MLMETVSSSEFCSVIYAYYMSNNSLSFSPYMLSPDHLHYSQDI